MRDFQTLLVLFQEPAPSSLAPIDTPFDQPRSKKYSPIYCTDLKQLEKRSPSSNTPSNSSSKSHWSSLNRSYNKSPCYELIPNLQHSRWSCMHQSNTILFFWLQIYFNRSCISFHWLKVVTVFLYHQFGPSKSSSLNPTHGYFLSTLLI
jgi:hypothetical protein